MNINQLLDLAVQRKASDIHLVTGYPPVMRLHGDLLPVPGADLLTQNDILGLVSPLLSPNQKRLFEEYFELDFSFGFENKARFRVNLYRQQGQVGADLRLIPLTIPKLDSLGLPPAVKKFVNLMAIKLYS